MYPNSAVYFPFNRVPAVFKNNGFTDDELMKLLSLSVNDTDGNTAEDRKKLLNNKYHTEQLSNAFRSCKVQDEKNGTSNPPMQQYAQSFVIFFLKHTQQGSLCKDAFQKALRDVKNQCSKNNRTHPVVSLGATIKTANNIIHAPKPSELHAFAEYLRRQYEASQAAEAGKQAQQAAAGLLLELAFKQ